MRFLLLALMLVFTNVTAQTKPQDNRIREIEANLPKVLPLYKQAKT